MACDIQIFVIFTSRDLENRSRSLIIDHVQGVMEVHLGCEYDDSRSVQWRAMACDGQIFVIFTSHDLENRSRSVIIDRVQRGASLV